MTQPNPRHSELTNGEASVLIAPVAGCEPEEVHEFLVITLTAEPDGRIHARFKTSMEDNEALEILVRAINNIVGDV